MAHNIKNVTLIGAGGLLGSKILSALEFEGQFNITALTRASSKSTFPSHIKVRTVPDDYPVHELTEAFTGQDAVVCAVTTGQINVQYAMIDAAVNAKVKHYIPSEFGNNQSNEARKIFPAYADKQKVIEYLQSKESKGLCWTAVICGQFFDWGIDTNWLGYDISKRRATIYDSGDYQWSTTTLPTVGCAVAKILLNLEPVKNQKVYVASFTLSQNGLLQVLENATGSKWDVERTTTDEALKIANELSSQDAYGTKLKLLIRSIIYADIGDRGSNFEKDQRMANAVLGLPKEELAEVVESIVRNHSS